MSSMCGSMVQSRRCNHTIAHIFIIIIIIIIIVVVVVVVVVIMPGLHLIPSPKAY